MVKNFRLVFYGFNSYLNKASDKGSNNWNKLKKNFIELCESMLKFQDECGMWYQVPNFPDRKPNYLETSGSAMYSYSFLKGFRLKILDEKFKDAGIKAFNEIIKRYLRIIDGKLLRWNLFCCRS